MIQAENEFGSYVAQRKDIPLEEHKKYLGAIKAFLADADFNVPFFTSDAAELFKGGVVDGALPTANGEHDIDNLKKAVNAYHGGTGPYMVGEYYPGWLDHWGEPFQKIATGEVTKQVAKYLKAAVSFNFYMVHGGTNFGFASGANYNREHDIQPDITSYDYDAPINEAGWPTAKYDSLRKLFSQYVPYQIPAVPTPPAVIKIEHVRLSKAVNLFALAEKMTPVINDFPQTFENLDQGSGYILYRKNCKEAIKGKLTIKGLRDYAVVYLNKKQIAVLDRNSNLYSCDVVIPADATIDILVENMGRINYGEAIVQNQKGIISPVIINNIPLTGNWLMYKFPMDHSPDLSAYASQLVQKNPVLYNGTFNLTTTGDSFLDMREWGKGIVFVNGHHLGRYWHIGPQQTLYLPGCWLNKGENTICIFEQLNEKIQTEINAIETPILDSLQN